MESIDDRGVHEGAVGENGQPRFPENHLPDRETESASAYGIHRFLRAKVVSWITDNTFSPGWLSGKWANPALGYITAVILQFVAIFVILTLVQIFPAFHFQSALVILVILVIALNWGAGPSLLATIIGIVLYDYFVFPPIYSFKMAAAGDAIGIAFYLIVGITVSVIAAQTEHARRHAEAVRLRLDTIIETIPDSIVLYDTDGNVTRRNKAAQQTIGAHFASSLSQSPHIYHPQTQDGLPISIGKLPAARALHGEKVSGTELTYFTTEGTKFIVSVNAAQFRSPDGASAGVVTISHDITAFRQAEEDAAMRAARQEAVFEAMADAVFVYDIDGHVIQMNEAARRLLALNQMPDYGSLSLQDRAMLMALPDENGYMASESDWPQMRILHGEVLTGNNTVDLKLRSLDGNEVEINAAGAPIRDEQGEITGGVLICRDVTEQRKLERSLRDSQRELAERINQLETIFDAMTDGVNVYDQQGHILQMNHAYRDFIALDAHPEHIALTSFERGNQLQVRDEQGHPLPDEQRPVTRMLNGEVLTGENATDIRLRALDGRELQLNISGSALRDQHGAINGGILIFRDVTERRRLERRTQEALKALLEMAEVLVSSDSLPIIEQTQPTSQEIAQRLAQLICRVLDSHDTTIIVVDPEKDQLQLLAAYGLSIEQQKQIEVWVKHIRLDEVRGSQNVAHLRAEQELLVDLQRPQLGYTEQPPNFDTHQALVIPMRHGDQLIGLLSLTHASDEHTYTDEEIALAQTVAKLTVLVIERERLLLEREEARANALISQEATRRMDQFLGIASHELKTPLTTVKGNIQLAKRRAKSSLTEIPPGSTSLRQKIDDVQMLLDRAERQADVQNRLISDLLDVSRIQVNRLEMRQEHVDLLSIVREAVEDVRYAGATRTFHMTLGVAELIPVFADADRITQVVSNYLTNALRYSPNESPIDIDVSIAGNNARVAVRDEGPGLSPDEQIRIWDRFYRVHEIEEQKNSGVGLGLGLYICRTIIEAHHGQYGVESTPGHGATFWFTLPLAVE
jgi:PAS domain S-box-containing protein